jgi:photoactive yellow protein
MLQMTNENTNLGINFEMPLLGAQLDAMRNDSASYDGLDFGLVAMDLDGTVVAYNRVESQLAGLSQERVIGLEFFTDVAPCTNNYLVSGRYQEAASLDEFLDYTFTLKMRPTPVRLRLLKSERADRQYLAIKR